MQPGRYVLTLSQHSMMHASRISMQQVAAAATEGVSDMVCPASCRHSLVWNCVCKHTKKPIILKGYVKVRQQWQQ
jgi:hypothetical protein